MTQTPTTAPRTRDLDRAATGDVGPLSAASAASDFHGQLNNAERSVVVLGHNNTVTMNGVTFHDGGGGSWAPVSAVAPVIARRDGPVYLRQDPPPVLIDRDAERAACRKSTGIVELYGEEGVGKSTLLAQLGHEMPEAADGVVYVDGTGLSLEELLFEIWQPYHETNVPWRVQPPLARMRLQLQNVAALFLLDDAVLRETELRTISTALPLSTVILTSNEQVLWGFGTSVGLWGLPLEHLPALVQAHLERAGLAHEQVPEEVLRRLAQEHGGNAALVARGVVRWINRARAGLPAGMEPGQVQRVVEIVHSLNEPVPADVLEAVAGLDEAPGIAVRLAEIGELKAHSPRYTHPWELQLEDEQLVQDIRTAALDYIAAQSDLDERRDLHRLAHSLLTWATTTPRLAVPALTVAKALAVAAARAGHPDQWAKAADDALSIALRSRDASSQAWAQHNLGAAALGRGEPAEARARLQEALQLYESVRAEQGVRERATLLLEEAVRQSLGGGTDLGVGGSASEPDSPQVIGPDSGSSGVALEVPEQEHPEERELVFS